MASYFVGTRAEKGQLKGAPEVIVSKAAVQIVQISGRVAYRGGSLGMHPRGVDGYSNVM